MLYIIYRIRVETADGKVLSYYGHTEDFEGRKNDHETQYRRWVRAGRPKKVSEVHGATRSVLVLDHEGWTMEEVDTIECDDEKDAEKLEGRWIRENDCVNRCIAGRTLQEWYQDTDYNRRYHITHRERRNQANKQYREKNREELKAKATEKVTCNVCGSLVSRSWTTEHKKTKKCLAAKLSQSITTNAVHVSSCA